MTGDPRDLDTYADGWDETDGADYCGTCAGCGTVYDDEDAPGLYEMTWPDERLLCLPCCDEIGKAESLADDAARQAWDGTEVW